MPGLLLAAPGTPGAAPRWFGKARWLSWSFPRSRGHEGSRVQLSCHSAAPVVTPVRQCVPCRGARRPWRVSARVSQSVLGTPGRLHKNSATRQLVQPRGGRAALPSLASVRPSGSPRNSPVLPPDTNPSLLLCPCLLPPFIPTPSSTVPHPCPSVPVSLSVFVPLPPSPSLPVCLPWSHSLVSPSRLLSGHLCSPPSHPGVIQYLLPQVTREPQCHTPGRPLRRDRCRRSPRGQCVAPQSGADAPSEGRGRTWKGGREKPPRGGRGGGGLPLPVLF